MACAQLGGGVSMDELLAAREAAERAERQSQLAAFPRLNGAAAAATQGGALHLRISWSGVIQESAHLSKAGVVQDCVGTPCDVKSGPGFAMCTCMHGCPVNGSRMAPDVLLGCAAEGSANGASRARAEAQLRAIMAGDNRCSASLS